MNYSDIAPIIPEITQLTKTHWDWWYGLDNKWQIILLNCLADNVFQGDMDVLNQLSLDEQLLKIINLEELFFDWNMGVNNTSFSVGDLSALHRLHKIVIVNCTRVDYQNLATVKNLTYLAIDKSQMIDLNGLSSLQSLKVLSLFNNEIVDVHPLAKLNGLIWLDLCLNFIQNIDPLETLTNLEYLNIADNPIDEIKINHLKNKLPNCVIDSEGIDSLLEYDISTFDEFELTLFNALNKNTPQ